MKKSQASNEAVIIIGFMVLFLILFMGVLSQRLSSVSDDRIRQLAEDLADVIESELFFAATVEDGYSREFVLPPRLDYIPYILEFNNQVDTGANFTQLILTADLGGKEYNIVRILPSSIRGELDVGRNKVTKTGGSINISSSVVGSWKFESAGLAEDSSGTSADGTVVGATWQSAGCHRGGCYSFDGAGNYVEVADSDSLSLSDGSLSFFAWINSNDISGTKTIIRKRANDYVLATVSSMVWCEVEGTDVNTGSTMSNGVWHHMGCTYDGTTLRSYLDGVEQDSVSVTAGADDDDILIIGKLQPTGGQEYNGLIDEVRIFSRALSAQEVAILASR